MNCTNSTPDTSCARVLVVPDTNVLLHCKQLSDLCWSEVEPGASEFEIVITREVIKEIDRLKRDGNSRRARRARSITSMLGDLLATPNGEKYVRGPNPRVFMRLADRSRINWDCFS